MRVGVLALQGGFDAHTRRLDALGASTLRVRQLGQLQEIDALVIPGGESTAVLTLLGAAGIEALKRFADRRSIFGTCAGAILLAGEVDQSDQPTIGVIDIGIRRNAFGRQIDSFIQEGLIAGAPGEMVFIRAPRIVRVGPAVEIVATANGEPVAVRQGRLLAATFHPELSDDPRMHRMFLELAADRMPVERISPAS